MGQRAFARPQQIRTSITAAMMLDATSTLPNSTVQSEPLNVINVPPMSVPRV
jgi:hypothetical protein